VRKEFGTGVAVFVLVMQEKQDEAALLLVNGVLAIPKITVRYPPEVVPKTCVEACGVQHRTFRSPVKDHTTMNPLPKPITILMADDEAPDRLLTLEALRDSRLLNDLRFVEDGEELMDYLHTRGKFAPPADAPRPGLILLDLNMPRMDGRTVLKEIKQDPKLREIPIAVLTASKDDEDVYRSYDLGVNSYIVKPVTFESLVDTLQSSERYYFQIVDLPAGPK